MNNALLILNAKIVNENNIIESDIYIRNGRIEKIAKNLSMMKVRQVLDVKGKYILPGMIDDNVHFREPGFSTKGDIYTESRAAVAGGVTTFFDMPDTCPNTLDMATLEEKMNLAEQHSSANYSFYLGASNDNIEVIKALDPDFNCGVNLNMGESTRCMLVDNLEILNDIFKHAPTLIAAYCEDMPTIIENEESYRQIYGDDIPFSLHPKIRSEDACFKSSSLAVELAKNHNSRLHVLQISTAKEVELFTDTALHEKRITAEVCCAYLDFTDEDYEKKGAIIKCSPAIKSEIDRAGLYQGLMDDRLDNIGTAHSPCDWADKKGNYFQVKSGMPLIQCALLSLLEHYQDGIFSLELIAQKTSHAVAEVFNIKDRGFIREGYWADLVVIDVDKPFTAHHEDVISKCSWTPFSGYEFRSSIHATIVNGRLVYINNEVRPGLRGMRVAFDRSQLRVH